MWNRLDDFHHFIHLLFEYVMSKPSTSLGIWIDRMALSHIFAAISRPNFVSTRYLPDMELFLIYELYYRASQTKYVRYIIK